VTSGASIGPRGIARRRPLWRSTRSIDIKNRVRRGRAKAIRDLGGLPLRKLRPHELVGSRHTEAKPPDEAHGAIFHDRDRLRDLSKEANATGSTKDFPRKTLSREPSRLDGDNTPTVLSATKSDRQAARGPRLCAARQGSSPSSSVKGSNGTNRYVFSRFASSGSERVEQLMAGSHSRNSATIRDAAVRRRGLPSLKVIPLRRCLCAP